MNEGKIGCYSILGVLLIGVGISLYPLLKPIPMEPMKIEEVKPDVSSPYIDEKPDPFYSMSPSEHLKIAKEEIGRYNLKKEKLGNLYLAKKHLAAIPQEVPEYQEAARLEPKIKRLEKDIEIFAKKFSEKITIDTRKNYAKTLENKLLDDTRLDTTISVIGENHTILKIKCIFVSRVFVNEIIKDGKVIVVWKEMGFKKVIFTDGYRDTWTLDLKKIP